MDKPYFLDKAPIIGPNTKILIQNVIEKFDYPVQSFRSCHGILRFAEKYGNAALEECCRNAIFYGKCSYTYIARTSSMYAETAPAMLDRMENRLKPLMRSSEEDISVTGIYKDDDDKYSLQNLLNRQKEGEQK